MPELLLSSDAMRAKQFVRARKRPQDLFKLMLGRPINRVHAYHCYMCDRAFLESLEGTAAIGAGASMLLPSGAFIACRQPDIYVAYCAHCAKLLRRCRNCGCTQHVSCEIAGEDGKPSGFVCAWVKESFAHPAGPICTECAVIG